MYYMGGLSRWHDGKQVPKPGDIIKFDIKQANKDLIINQFLHLLSPADKSSILLPHGIRITARITHVDNSVGNYSFKVTDISSIIINESEILKRTLVHEITVKLLWVSEYKLFPVPSASLEPQAPQPLTPQPPRTTKIIVNDDDELVSHPIDDMYDSIYNTLQEHLNKQIIITLYDDAKKIQPELIAYLKQFEIIDDTYKCKLLVINKSAHSLTVEAYRDGVGKSENRSISITYIKTIELLT